MTIADDAPRPDRVGVGEVILEIAAEGGSLTIVGIKAADGWRFRLVRDETTLRAFLNAKDAEGLIGLGQTIRHCAGRARPIPVAHAPSVASASRFQRSGLGGGRGAMAQGRL
jgi:hypothetical protein